MIPALFECLQHSFVTGFCQLFYYSPSLARTFLRVRKLCFSSGLYWFEHSEVCISLRQMECFLKFFIWFLWVFV